MHRYDANTDLRLATHVSLCSHAISNVHHRSGAAASAPAAPNVAAEQWHTMLEACGASTFNAIVEWRRAGASMANMVAEPWLKL